MKKHFLNGIEITLDFKIKIKKLFVWKKEILGFLSEFNNMVSIQEFFILWTYQCNGLHRFPGLKSFIYGKFKAALSCGCFSEKKHFVPQLGQNKPPYF